MQVSITDILAKEIQEKTILQVGHYSMEKSDVLNGSF
mgnify:CR=1 FL=1